uniref:Uncharacterized protein n=1 Tax=Sparus aurata TaxID=8175 RepID=A0A671YTM5_SPAAU
MEKMGWRQRANTTFNNQIWPQKKCRTIKRGELLTKPLCPLSHLQQAVAHKRHQELVTVPLAHHGGVL